MKQILFTWFIVTSLMLSGCSLVPPPTNTCSLDSDCKEQEMCYIEPQATTGTCVAKAQEPGVDDATPPAPVVEENGATNPSKIDQQNNQTTPTNTPPPTTISTEDLTKELDAFVDDITKGL